MSRASGLESDTLGLETRLAGPFQHCRSDDRIQGGSSTFLAAYDQPESKTGCDERQRHTLMQWP
jgi:hypothetical protein